MKISQLKLLLLFPFLFMGSVSGHSQFWKSIFVNQQYGRGGFIPLKRQLRSQFPGLNIQDLEISQVRIYGTNNMYGNASVSLTIGQNSSNVFPLVNAPMYTYINGPTYERQFGRWQVNIFGFATIHRVDILLRENYSDSYGSRPYPKPIPGRHYLEPIPIKPEKLGSFEIQKTEWETYNLNLNGNSFEKITLRTIDNDVMIDKTIIMYQDGHRETIIEFQGLIKEDGTRYFFPNGRVPQQIKIYAKRDSWITGSRSTIEFFGQ